MPTKRVFLASTALAAMLPFVAPVDAATTTVAQGQTVTTQQSLSGTDTLDVEAGGALSTGSDPAITQKNAATGVTVENAGTIESTADDGRAMNVSGSAMPRTITIDNAAGGIIQSQNDAIRINTDVGSGTITVNNAGTIRTTAGGQALDFDAIDSGTATVQINNLAGGVIASVEADAVRPGEGGVVDNAGLIRSDSTADSSDDGIDMQGHSATVVNETTGVISGARHGITSDVDLNVTNYGSITGRNGSGVGSDGNGTVVNYGTITGAYDGVSTNGDGDGVDIDYVANVTNSGTIQGTGAAGVDKGGQPNTSEGLAIGGGTVVNNAGALISGQGNGILVDDGSGGAGYAATSITNTGTIRGVTGAGITLVGDYDDTIVNTGTISGGNGVAISMGGGDDHLTLLPGSVIEGTVDGGDGTDQVTLAGSGTGSFAGATNFEHLDVASGSWTLTGASTFVQGTSIDSGAKLTGNADTLTGAIIDNGTLVFDQTSDGTFTGSLGGTGALQKTGGGTLTIGSNPFTGTTDVIDGTLLLAGSFPSAVAVEQQATLAGNGSVASANIMGGGTIAPGVGTLTVTGNLIQQAGSTYAATVLASGNSSLIAVGGAATIADGATITVARGAGLTIGTRYTLLTAAGGITGSYTVAQTATDGTEFRLGTSGNSLYVDLARTGASLASVATTRDQQAAAAGLASLDATNAAYAALTLDPSDAGVRSGLEQLSGQIHASVRTAVVHDTQAAEGAILSRLDTTDAQTHGLWGQFVGGHGEDDGVFGASDTNRDTFGGVIGYDRPVADGLRVGIAGGYTHTRLWEDALDSRARISTAHVLAYAGGSYGAVRVDFGLGYEWNRIHTDRTVAFAGFGDIDRARYNGDLFHGFGTLGYALPLGGGTVEPFVGGSIMRIHDDAFTEKGGAAALQSADEVDYVGFSDVGLKVATPMVGALSARASVAWQHAYNMFDPYAVLNFAGSTPFTVVGAGLSRDAAAPTADLVWRGASGLTLTAGYAGLIGSRGMDNSGRVSVGFAF